WLTIRLRCGQTLKQRPDEVSGREVKWQLPTRPASADIPPRHESPSELARWQRSPVLAAQRRQSSGSGGLVLARPNQPPPAGPAHDQLNTYAGASKRQNDRSA